jgi:membrane protease YdiL (CAAX protease family)
MGVWWYRRARRLFASGNPEAKVKLYRSMVGEQIVTTAAVLALWRSGATSASLGFVAPRSWALTVATALIIIVALVWSSLRIRPKAQKLRQKLQDGIGALLPESPQERFWWGAVSVGAGVSEEFAFRGFLFYYCTHYLPHTNLIARVLLTSLVFGLAHIYQGKKGAIGAGILGLALAGLYLMTGSLLLPVVIHAAVDWRILLMFPPEAAPAAAVEGIA